MHYHHQWSSREQVQVGVESQDSQGDWGDVVQTHLEELGGQEQQPQLGPPLSPPHTETSLRRDSRLVQFQDMLGDGTADISGLKVRREVFRSLKPMLPQVSVEQR